MDTTYRVVLALETTGSLGMKLGEVGEKIGRVHEQGTRFQHAMLMTGEVVGRAFERVGGLIESVADKMIHVTEVGATLGAGALFAGATYGVAHLNEELERTQISLGAIFQAQGFSRDFSGAFAMAADQLAKMKQDVKTLPGDLGQLSGIMTMIATPAAQGGLGADAIRKLAGQTMLVGTILGVQQDQASREMANLLAGRAGAHNILGSRLGLIGAQAQRFNAEAPSARVAEIEQVFARYQGANERFAQSFVANWTTLKDNIKYGFIADATAPLFDAVKRTMASINDWFDKNQDRVKVWAMTFGQHLTQTWTMLTHAAERFGPSLDHLGHVFFELWDQAIAKAKDLEPIVGRVTHLLENLSAGDLKDVLKLMVELKVAGKGTELLGGGIGAATTGLRLVGAWRGLSGGGAAVAADEGAESALGTGLWGKVGAVTGAVGAGASFALVAGTIVNLGVWLHGLVDSIHEFTQTVHSQNDKAEVVKTAQERAAVAMDHLGGALDANTAVGLGLQGALDNLFVRVDRLNPTETPPDIKEHDFGPVIGMGLAGVIRAQQQAEEAKKKLPGGGGGTVIQKVEINVRGNDDPSRVARLVAYQLDKVARNPKRSPGVPDWAATTAAR